jgi:hypothetical protein
MRTIGAKSYESQRRTAEEALLFFVPLAKYLETSMRLPRSLKIGAFGYWGVCRNKGVEVHPDDNGAAASSRTSYSPSYPIILTYIFGSFYSDRLSQVSRTVYITSTYHRHMIGK